MNSEFVESSTIRNTLQRKSINMSPVKDYTQNLEISPDSHQNDSFVFNPSTDLKNAINDSAQ